MKTRSWAKISTAFAFCLLWTSCGSDWGHVDPPAANDVAPTLEKVCEFTFDDEGGLDASVFTVVPYPDGSMPALIADDMTESVVLDLTGGYAKIKNPLASYEVQKGVSITFWMKQVSDSIYDEEGVATGKVVPQDVTTPLLHWENLNASATFDFSTNGWINYDGIDGKQSFNNPGEYKTGYITPDEWHYVALIVRNDGYGLYVDGQKKDEQFTEKSLASAVQLLAKAENLYINYGASTHSKYLIDDLKLYRNIITSKEIARPTKGKIGKDDVGGSTVEAEIMDEVLTDPILGNEDNSTPWWSAWTPVVRLTGDGVMHYEFTNYSTTEQNYHNWVIVITNGHERDEEGYEEIIVMRADAYGWGNNYGDAKIEHNYNWDTFAKQMDGTKFTVEVIRKGSDLVIESKGITPAGEEMNQTVTVPGVDVEKIGSFFTCEGAHLDFDLDATFKGRTYPEGTRFVGAEDFSNGFWTDWSVMEKKESEFSRFGFEFVNHSMADGNWKFWNLVVTNGYQSAPDDQKDPNYKEYYYLRCDAYGWGDLYGSSTMTQAFNWDTYQQDMNEATTHIYFSYSKETLSLLSREEKADGTFLPDYRFVTPGIELPIGFVFTCEGSWLEIRKIGYFPWAKID